MVKVSGQVLTSNGQNIGGARISFTSSEKQYIILSSPLGFYKFDITAGNYTITVKHKLHSFETMNHIIGDENDETINIISID